MSNEPPSQVRPNIVLAGKKFWGCTYLFWVSFNLSGERGGEKSEYRRRTVSNPSLSSNHKEFDPSRGYVIQQGLDQ